MAVFFCLRLNVGLREQQWDVGGDAITAIELAERESSGNSSNSSNAVPRGQNQYAPSLRHNYQRKWQAMQFWDKIYGFDMTAISEHAKGCEHVREPTVEVVPAEVRA